MSNVIVVATLQIQAGKEDAARAFMTETIEATHREDGCRLYALHVDQNDPSQFVIVERWDDQAALEAHFATPHMAQLVARGAEFFAAQPTILFTEAVPAGDPAKGTLAGA